MAMMRKQEFYGSTTVGERGQIVLPAELRKAFKLNPGDKLIVLGERRSDDSLGRVVLVKAEMLNKIIEHMEKHQQEIREILDKSKKD